MFFFKTIPPYNSLTPLTITTNQSPPLTITNTMNLSVQQYLNSDNRSINIYERIRLSSDHHYCSCCSCTLAHYQQKHYIHTPHQLTPSYYSYVSPSSKIICQNSSLEKSHYKQQCLCQNFFVPIK